MSGLFAFDLDEVVLFEYVCGEGSAVDAAGVETDEVGGVALGSLLVDESAWRIVAEHDDFAVDRFEVIVPPWAFDSIGGWPRAYGEEFFASGAIEALLRMDARVDEDEVHFPNVERLDLEPEGELFLDLVNLRERRGLALVGFSRPGDQFDEFGVVVSHHHLCAGLKNQPPDAERVGPFREGVACEEKSIGALPIATCAQNLLKFFRAPVDVSYKDRSHRCIRRGLVLELAVTKYNAERPGCQRSRRIG